MQKGSYSLLPITLTGFLLTSCTFHDINLSPNLFGSVEARPTYSSTATEIPADVKQSNLQSPWWHDFSDSQLNMFVSQGYENNLDVVQALSRVQQARALTMQSRSELFPQIDAQGNISKQWDDEDVQPTSSSIGGALSWEIDLFGRIQSDITAREYEALASAEDVNATLLTLSSDIALAYYGAINAHKQKQLIESQIKTDKDLLSLVDLRVENGIGTRVDQLQQQSNVATSESLIPLVEADIRVFENRLDVLLGRSPDGIDRTNDQDAITMPTVTSLVGVPINLLENRPDLRALKNELIAADADIGRAIADRLPQITLNGSYLYSDTATNAGPLGTVLGAFVQPLMDWGDRKAEVKRNKAIYQERLAAYTQAFLQAVEEVENTLYLENKQRDYLDRLNERDHILRGTVEEARARYDEGLDDYTPVLNALQELRALERTRLNEEYQLIQYRIGLYRALGGRIN